MEQYNRRKFLKDACQTSLQFFVAFNLGCAIKETNGSASNKATAIIYGTRYGATLDTAKWISKGLEDSVDLINIEKLNFKKALTTYEKFILGSGVWVGGVHARLKDFVSSHSDHLQNRVIASFVVCGSQNNTAAGRKQIKYYLAQINRPLNYEPQFVRQFGGRIEVDRLSEEDRDALSRFYKKYLNKELENWDRTNEMLANNFGDELKEDVTQRISNSI